MASLSALLTAYPDIGSGDTVTSGPVPTRWLRPC